MVRLYGLNPNKALIAQMLDVAQHWSPYRSLAVKYLLTRWAFNK